MRKRIAGALVALIVAAGLVTASAPQAEAAKLGCTYDTFGNVWFFGEGAGVKCSGDRFKTTAHKYRVYVICDRVGWQANVVRYGSWEWANARSWAKCGAIGDWERLGYGVQYN